MSKKEYETGKIAVNAVIFTKHNNKLQVLLHKREKQPFKSLLELPGGLLKPNETAEQTLKRKLDILTGHKNIFFQQFFTFTTPNRDPRERVVSIGFIALINKEKLDDLNNWHDYTSVPKLAFDHKDIIQKARQYLQENTNPSIVKQFMLNQFPLNKLQEVYELLEDKKYDNRNFRKKMISSGIVEETDNKEINVSHRPAKLFKFR